jgi:hypothetical protein
MNEMVRISAKMLEGNRENKTSQIRNNDIPQSKDSLINKNWFLQKTINNQAVARLIKSVLCRQNTGSDNLGIFTSRKLTVGRAGYEDARAEGIKW